MAQPTKSKAVLETELETCTDIAERVFGIELNLHTLQEQIQGIMVAKLEEYYRGRFRDWAIIDLQAMVEHIDEVAPPRETVKARIRRQRRNRLDHEQAVADLHSEDSPTE